MKINLAISKKYIKAKFYKFIVNLYGVGSYENKQAKILSKFDKPR